jgi:peptide-methionine (S)-S-oxide reductase
MTDNKEKIYFAGGCFWCLEAIFQKLRGVEKITSGYIGGTTKSPSYKEVSTGKTGYIEAIEIIFDPKIITLDDLLAVFFTAHDPTSKDRQGGDVGPQYRSAIYFTSQNQKTTIEKFIKKLTANQIFDKPILTELKPFKIFYPAEDYHQNYYLQNRYKNPYCLLVINPKIKKLKKSFSHLLKSQ